MFSLFLRNLFFTVLQPGVVTGLIPYWILRKKFFHLLPGKFEFRHYCGIVVFALGLTIMVHCIISFATKGRGTLSPADPTKKLVISGLYKFSRNPMYVGVMLILIGESIFFLSASLWLYVLAVFVAFNLFITFFEEPRLLKDFGEEYKAYRQQVRKWI